MAVTKHFENGSEFWQVYVKIRSAVIPSIRLQKRIRGILTEKAALPKPFKEEKRLLAELTRQITKLEARGETWDQLISKYSGAGSMQSSLSRSVIMRTPPLSINP